MIRVGIVGTNTSHAAVFAGILNGADGSPPAVDDAQVVGVWSSGRPGLSGLHSDADELAQRYRIAAVVDDPAELITGTDLVLILDDVEGGALHPELARPFLEAGVATFVDKPMALEVDAAVDLFDRAEAAGAALLSCSSLRFSQQLSPLRAVGELSTVFSVGPGDWYNYGVHAVEAAVAVCGPLAVQVHQFAAPDRDITAISGDDGPRIVIGTLRDVDAPFQLTGFGSAGVAQTQVDDYQDFYTNTIRAAVQMARTGVAPVGRQETLEVLTILAAGQQSARTGKPVPIETPTP